MIGRPGWVVARWVRRAAWWVFVVVALVAGRVSWLRFGDERPFVSQETYASSVGGGEVGTYNTTIEMTYDVGRDGAWVTPASAVIAAVLIVSAVIHALLTRRGRLVTVMTVAAAPLCVFAVSAAVNGIGRISFAALPAAGIVLAAVALHETATALARPRRDP
ncbi:hypothetical protein [Williamsia deligens]|uniref:Dolichyl-phosphate-mannose-protein mannosyltransferase n=1 Tax=Williamsia deligens TaxID=321325 RepID=A0ABW3G1D5_9NOCA|nr:hypothetical protein [Williamsia deligens]MCP2194930.1 hypothetical protein [Williamsia deligens]